MAGGWAATVDGEGAQEWGGEKRVTRSRLGQSGRPSQTAREASGGGASQPAQSARRSSHPAQHADQPAVQQAGVEWPTLEEQRPGTHPHHVPHPEGSLSRVGADLSCQDPDSSRPWLRVLILARCVLVARPGEQGKAGGRLASQRGKEALLWQEALGELSRSRGGARGVKQSLLSRRTTPTEPDPCSKRGSSPWLPGLSRRCRASTLRPPLP